MAPALTFNAEALETDAVQAGHVIGLLRSVAAAAHVRSGRLVPLLVHYIADRSSVFVHYGSRTALASRVRAFIDVAIELLTDNPAYVVSSKKLATAETVGRRG